MTLILVGFFLIQSHKLSQDDLSYDILNCIGSVLLIIYGIAGKAWPFVILNDVPRRKMTRYLCSQFLCFV